MELVLEEEISQARQMTENSMLGTMVVEKLTYMVKEQKI
jgi:hypothetical protein